MFRNRIVNQVIRQYRGQKYVDYARVTIFSPYYAKIIKKPQSTIAAEESYVKKFMKTVGWMDKERTRLKLTGYFLYECVPEKVCYQEWFDILELPDTFASWFIITELHVWLILVRYMAEDVTVAGEKKKMVKGDGHFVRNCVIEALWADVANRIKLLEGANIVVARKQVTELSEQFQAALVGYDEGLEDDKVLASAVWRRFYSLSVDTKAEHVEKIVHFIRHQMSALDQIPSKDLKWQPQITWLSIHDH
ncbi:ubiquinol-cytochrome-c reductase complex assembly factor 1 [Pieris napi]|uniref:ubiquinol-cytochrome-c reductase complex assembly factor 1 n=1 Tax=Pieris napi TaxID=78633 RepID=UPI001FBB20EF|nr:ubiquinol-cytochrome-c reductase complex assembly factor 1 [Pieris napi]